MKRNRTKKSIILSVLSLLLCVSMFASSTYAWFTDEVSSGVNQIIAGNLDVELTHTNANITSAKPVDNATNLFTDKDGNEILWEPGVIAYENFSVSNVGSLALKYNMSLSIGDYNYTTIGTINYDLRTPLKVKVLTGDDILTTVTRETVQALDWTSSSTLEGFAYSGKQLYPVNNPSATGSSNETFQVIVYWEPTDNDNNWNVNNGRTTSDGNPLFIDFGVYLVATQLEYESDSFDDQYDASATYPSFPTVVKGSGTSDTAYTSTKQGDDVTTSTEALSITIKNGALDIVGSATVPNGAASGVLTDIKGDNSIVDSTETYAKDSLVLTLNVETTDVQDSSITLDVTMDSLFTRVEGDTEADAEVTQTISGPVSELDNAVTVEINLEAGLSDVRVNHSHNSVTTAMERVNSIAELANGKFYYDETTGKLTLMTDKFSEFTVTFVRENVVENINKKTVHATLDSAIADASAEDTLKLNKDVAFGEVTKEVSLDLNGNNISNVTLKANTTINGDGSYSLEIEEGKTVTVTSGAHETIGVTGSGDLVITGGKYKVDVSQYLDEYHYILPEPDEDGWYVVYATGDAIAATVNGYGYDSVQGAIEAANANDKVVLQKDVNESITITDKSLTIDLNGKTITGTDTKYAVCVYDVNGVTIKNGNINNNGVVFRIGEHQSTVVKYKTDGSTMWGYHPLAPAQNITIDNINSVSSSTQPVFYYTNIEDDLYRADKSNPTDRDLYGNWIYKTGYTSQEQYNNKDAERGNVFTHLEAKDSVTVTNCSFDYAGSFTGNMNSEAGLLYTEVLNVESGVYSNDSVGRFVNANKYLVGNSSSNFVVSDGQPSDYTYGKVNNIYYNYVGGANAAINYANFGETVYIKENADAEKVFGMDQNLIVQYDAENVSYTGAKPDTGYKIKTRTVDVDNKIEFYAEFNVVAEVYRTTNNTVQPALTEENLVGRYPTVAEAFAAANNNGQFSMVRLVDDYEGGDDAKYYYTDKARNAGAHSGSSVRFDLNGYTWTYTGTNNALVITTQSGSSSKATVILDSSSGKTGKIVAANGRAIYKENSTSENTYIKSGTFIAKNQPVYINKLSASGKSGRFYIEGGTFISTNNSAIYLGWTHSSGLLGISGGNFTSKAGSKDISGMTVIPCQISGGTFHSDPTTFSSNVTITKTCTDNGDGSWTVK